jgi:hypothetical protein
MQKIISLFQRDYDRTRLVYDSVVSGAEWVVAGEGRATIKWDGTACRITIEDNTPVLWKRYDAKNGKTPPNGWEAAQEADSVTGHHPGWLRCSRENPADKWAFEALDNLTEANDPRGARAVMPGTYELIGPKIGNKGSGNPYELDRHFLIRHGSGWTHTSALLVDVPRTFEGLRSYFIEHPELEGVVWHHDDGRMVKLKRRDYGLPWPAKE